MESSLITFWMNLENSNGPVFIFLMVPCATSPVGKWRQACYLYGLDKMVKIYMSNFNLQPYQTNGVNYILQCFEEFCEPICNFRVAIFKFTKVSQCQGENVDTFYNRILKLARQSNFSDMNEWLIDAIIFGTMCVKAQDKLLQMPNTLNLQQCLTVCRHYEKFESPYSANSFWIWQTNRVPFQTSSKDQEIWSKKVTTERSEFVKVTIFTIFTTESN